MEVDYEILDDEIVNQLESRCSGALDFPNVKLVASGTIISSQIYSNITDFEVRDDDTWLLGPPRCGSTWCQEMIWLLRNDLNFEKAKAVIQSERFPNLPGFPVVNKDGSVSPPEFYLDLESPRCIKSHYLRPHLPKQLWTKRPKIIFLSRNPKDVAISLSHFYKLIFHYTGPMDLVLKAYVQDKALLNPYWTYVLEFWALRHETNIFFLTYEEMKKDLPGVIRRVADFLEVQCTTEQEAALLDHLSIDSMRDNKTVNKSDVIKAFKLNSEEESFIRQGEAGGWRRVMTPEMVQMFDDWIEKNLEGSDYPRNDL